MLGLSLPEIVFLAVLALVIIGPKQLPEVARTIGRVLNELRRASSSLTDELRQQVKIDPININNPSPTEPAGAQPETTDSSAHPTQEPPGGEASTDSEVKKS